MRWMADMDGPASKREQLFEGLVTKLMLEQGIDDLEVPVLMRCGCEKCLIMIALYQMVAPMVRIMSNPSGVVN